MLNRPAQLQEGDAGACVPSPQPRPMLARRTPKRSAKASGRPRAQKRSPSVTIADISGDAAEADIAEKADSKKRKRAKSSVYQGVSWHKGNERWRANISYRAPHPFYHAMLLRTRVAASIAVLTVQMWCVLD